MLSLALSEALKGVDISRRYPQFYGQLLTNETLRRDFLAGLCLLEPDSLDRLEPLPGRPSRDLRFLSRTARPEPAIIVQGERSWRLVWELTEIHLQERLRDVFWEPAHLPICTDWGYVTLLDDHAMAAGQRVSMLLDIIPPRTVATDKLHLRFVVTAAEQLPLQIMVRWGTYSFTAPVRRPGITPLPVPLSAFCHPGGVIVRDSLLVMLEATPPAVLSPGIPCDYRN